MNDLKKILVPVDFSDSSRAALDMAIGLANRLGGSVDVLHVVEFPVYAVPEMSVAIPGIASQSLETFAITRSDDDMKRFVASFAETARTFGLTIKSDCIRGEA